MEIMQTLEGIVEGEVVVDVGVGLVRRSDGVVVLWWWWCCGVGLFICL